MAIESINVIIEGPCCINNIPCPVIILHSLPGHNIAIKLLDIDTLTNIIRSYSPYCNLFPRQSDMQH